MKVAIVSDTHIPSRAQRIPEAFRERIEEADHVIHAGDFDVEGTIADVRDLSTELTAVKGNMDPQVGLPAVASVVLGGVEFVVTHGTGPAGGYEDRIANAAKQHGGEGREAAQPRNEEGGSATVPVGVAGHSHEVVDTTHDGVRLLNPGSATGASPASRATMMTADVADGDLDVTVHEL